MKTLRWYHIYKTKRRSRFTKSLPTNILTLLEQEYGKRVARRVIGIIQMFTDLIGLENYHLGLEEKLDKLLEERHAFAEERPFEEIIKMQYNNSKSCATLTNYERVITELKLAQIAYDVAHEHDVYATV
jgi:hypothetical protein